MIHRAGRLLLGALAAGAAGIAVLLAVLAWLLAVGPISLTFLSPYVADALRQAELAPRIDFDDLVLTWAGWDRPLDVRVTGVRLLRDNGDLVASVPEVSVGLNARALIKGRVGLGSLEMTGAVATLVRDAGGRITLGPPGEDAEAEGFAARLLGVLLKPPDDSQMLGGLRHLRVVDADITFEDRIAQTSWHAPKAALALVRDEAGIDVNAEVDIDLDDTLVHLALGATYDNGRREARFTVRFSDIEPARLQGAAAALAPLAVLKMPLSGTVEFTVGSGWAVSGVTFDVDAGPGYLDLPRVYPKPQPVERLSARGYIDDSLDALHLESLSADLGGPSAALSGTLWFLEGHFGVRAQGEVHNLSVAELKRLWPLKLSRSAREWSMIHLQEGLVSRAAFRIDVPPEVLARGRLPDEAVALDFDFEGGSVVYYSALPPITDGKGTVHMSGARFDLSLAEGRTAGLGISEGTLSISGLNTLHKSAEIDALVAGPVQKAMTLLDREPLGFARKGGLDPTSLGGEAAARLRFRFPIKRELLPARLQFSAAANLNAAAIANLYGKYELKDGNLELQVDGHGAALSGRAVLNGVPLEIAWHRSFEPEAAVRARYALSGILDNAAREALFLPAGDYLEGPVAMDLEVLVDDAAAIQATADVDLKTAQATIPALRWHKPAETEGSLHMVLSKPANGDLVVDSFTLAAADLMASGAASFAADGSLHRLDFSRLLFGGPQGTDVSASLSRREDDGYALTIEGRRLDFRPYLEQPAEDGDRAATPPLSVTAHVRRLILGEGLELKEARATGSHDGARWETVQMGGSLNGGAPLEVTLNPHEGGRRLKMTSTDAGSVARALDLFFNVEGGRLEINALIHDELPGRPIEGEVTIDNFRLVKAPLLARLFALASLTGMLDLLNGEGIKFVRLSAPFTLAEDKVTLEQARAHGAAVGITAEGVIDRGAGTTDLRGSIVPAYTINSLLGKIPLLGRLLIGKEGEGIIGVAYSIKGSSENPRVEANPLSVLAPGFLRRLFFIGSSGKAGSSGETFPERDEDRGVR